MIPPCLSQEPAQARLGRTVVGTSVPTGACFGAAGGQLDSIFQAEIFSPSWAARSCSFCHTSIAAATSQSVPRRVCWVPHVAQVMAACAMSGACQLILPGFADHDPRAGY
jgi:hypothetical protein